MNEMKETRGRKPSPVSKTTLSVRVPTALAHAARVADVNIAAVLEGALGARLGFVKDQDFRVALQDALCRLQSSVSQDVALELANICRIIASYQEGVGVEKKLLEGKE